MTPAMVEQLLTDRFMAKDDENDSEKGFFKFRGKKMATKKKKKQISINEKQ